MTEELPGGRRAARRARARRASALVPLLVAVGAFVLAGTVLIGRPVFAVAVFALQVVAVFGWSGVVAAPPRVANLVLGVVAAVAVDASLLLLSDAVSLRPLAAVLAGVFIVALLTQLARGKGRSGVLPALTSCMFAAVLVIMAGCWLAGASGMGAYVVAVTLAAVGAGALAESALAALRLPTLVRALFTIGVATAAGAGAGVVAGLGAVAGVGTGLVAGLFTAAAFAVVGSVREQVDTRVTFGVALPLAAVAPAAYLLSRLLGG